MTNGKRSYSVHLRQEHPGTCELVTVVDAENEWQAVIKAIKKAEKMTEMKEAGRPEDLKIWIVERREKTFTELLREGAE